MPCRYITEDLFYFLINKKFVNPELIEVKNFDQSIHVQSWPEYDLSLTDQEAVNIAVQVNGKVRTVLKDVQKGQNGEQVYEQAAPLLTKYLENKSILNKIYVQDKILNIVVN